MQWRALIGWRGGRSLIVIGWRDSRLVSKVAFNRSVKADSLRWQRIASTRDWFTHRYSIALKSRHRGG